MTRIKTEIATWLLKWVPDLVIDSHLPARIGRYRVVDILLEWTNAV